jgi:hypothetical protein
VAGGGNNVASATFASVGGGNGNTASGSFSTVAGGDSNTAGQINATVGGGTGNSTSSSNSTIGGGASNTINTGSAYSAIAGGCENTATGEYATITGGWGNTAAGYASVGGGIGNNAGAEFSCVPGGGSCRASGMYSVAGGRADTAASNYSFATCYGSIVPSSYSNSAAFNGEVATASNQTRVGVLSKAGGTFTIDHPLDPHGKILNHYFIEGPEMLNIYRGAVVLNGTGRATVELPDYFTALNRSPHVQLTGVGTFEVYVAEEVRGNRFTIGGKPGTKVFWQVTGERKDVSAEATRRMMPVEQLKTGELAGRMLDDDFLAGCMDQLVREGKAQGISFRTAGGRAKYEKMRQVTENR